MPALRASLQMSSVTIVSTCTRIMLSGSIADSNAHYDSALLSFAEAGFFTASVAASASIMLPRSHGLLDVLVPGPRLVFWSCESLPRWEEEEDARN